MNVYRVPYIIALFIGNVGSSVFPTKNIFLLASSGLENPLLKICSFGLSFLVIPVVFFQRLNASKWENL